MAVTNSLKKIAQTVAFIVRFLFVLGKVESVAGHSDSERDWTSEFRASKALKVPSSAGYRAGNKSSIADI